MGPALKLPHIHSLDYISHDAVADMLGEGHSTLRQITRQNTIIGAALAIAYLDEQGWLEAFRERFPEIPEHPSVALRGKTRSLWKDFKATPLCVTYRKRPRLFLVPVGTYRELS